MDEGLWAARVLLARINEACYWAQVDGAIDDNMQSYMELLSYIQRASNDQLEILRKDVLSYNERKISATELVINAYTTLTANMTVH